MIQVLLLSRPQLCKPVFLVYILATKRPRLGESLFTVQGYTDQGHVDPED